MIKNKVEVKVCIYWGVTIRSLNFHLRANGCKVDF